jgi:hypothetical protein
LSEAFVSIILDKQWDSGVWQSFWRWRRSFHSTDNKRHFLDAVVSLQLPRTFRRASQPIRAIVSTVAGYKGTPPTGMREDRLGVMYATAHVNRNAP